MKNVSIMKNKLIVVILLILLLLPINAKAEDTDRKQCGYLLSSEGSGNATKFRIGGKYAWCTQAGKKSQNNWTYDLTPATDSHDFFARFVYSAYDLGKDLFNDWEVYLTIRDVARTGSSSRGVFTEIKNHMTSNKCTVYSAKSYWRDGSNCKPRGSDSQEMLVVECTKQPEQETGCPSSEKCCTKDGKYYIYGQQKTKAEYDAACSSGEEGCPSTEKCCEKNGKYYIYGQQKTKAEYDAACPSSGSCPSSEKCCINNGNYYVYGQQKTKAEYDATCPSSGGCPNTEQCCTKNGKYYVYGQQKTKAEYDAACPQSTACPSSEKCCQSNGEYYSYGVKKTKAQYDNICPCDQAGCCKANSKYYIDRIEVTEGQYATSCCEEFYELCCVLNNKYYLEGEQVEKKKCLSCKPLVSYHESCQIDDLDEMGDMPSYDGKEKGDLVKTKFEDNESINFISYKEVDDDNIVKCVLTKQTDFAENTLMDPNIIGASNPYCKVFCKEDVGKFDDETGELREEPFKYGYSISGMQEANSGRYFRLNAEFTSKRTCYSTSNDDNSETKEINLDKFNADVKAAVERINNLINSLNKSYAEYVFMRDNYPTKGTTPGSNSGYCDPSSFTINTLSYNNLSGLQKPPHYIISLDKEGSTEHHLSFKVETSGYENPSPPTYWQDDTEFDKFAYYDTWDCTSWSSEWPYYCTDWKLCEDCGSVSCYKSSNNVDSLFQTSLAEKRNEYLGYKSQIETEFEKIKSYIKSINECTDWFDVFTDSLYNPDPTVTYKYGFKDEDGNNDYDYYEKLNKKEMEREDIPSISKTEKWTAKTTEYDDNGNPKLVIPSQPEKLPCVDDKYMEERGISCTDVDGDTDSVTYLRGLDDKGYYFDVPTESKTFKNNTYMRKSIERTYKFTSPNEYATLYPSGVIVLRKDENFDESEKVDFDGLPVQIETSNGPHKFTFTFSDIGEYFDTDATGRIFDSDNNKNVETVLGKYDAEEHQIFTDTMSQKEYNYVCYYRVNCPNCDVECEGDDCEDIIPDCPGGHCCPYCNPECVDCIYSRKEYELDVTPIPTKKTSLPSGSPSNPGYPEDPSNPSFELFTVVNPNGNEYVPYNWNIWNTYEDYGDRYDIINDKAKLTIDEIQTYGELIYVSEELGTDDVYEGHPVIEGISSPIDFGVLKVVMTPALAQEIRNYNRNAEASSGSGGFTNNTLTCYDYTYGGAKFENIFCYSSFLDTYKDNPNFTFYSGRIKDEEERKHNNNQNGYWQTFLSQPNCDGQNCGSKHSGNIVKIQKGDMERIGGPSWK